MEIPGSRIATLPDASVVIPVNAQGDIPHALRLLDDIQRYDGAHRLEILMVVNNYPASEPPAELEVIERRGARVLAIPDVQRAGYSVGIVARAHGLRVASAEVSLLFDADCRIPQPTPLVDWYVNSLTNGAVAAYTPVRHFDLHPGISVQLRVFTHHAGRWVKRALLRIPTIRGSNYAVLSTEFLRLFDEGFIVHDMNVGPAIKSSGGRIDYSGRKEHAVLTSGRVLRGGWGRLLRFIPRRIAYNLRTLPVRRHTRVPNRTEPPDV